MALLRLIRPAAGRPPAARRRASAVLGALPEQVGALYRLALQREPSATELQLLSGYAEQHGLENASRLVLNSNEFLFVD